MPMHRGTPQNVQTPGFMQQGTSLRRPQSNDYTNTPIQRPQYMESHTPTETLFIPQEPQFEVETLPAHIGNYEVKL